MRARPVLSVLGVELAKLRAQWRLRAALLVVLLGPPLVTLVLQAQTGLPTDTLYGRWVQEIGLSVPLVLLGSAGTYVIPLLATLVAGDVLSGEDQHGMWGALLTRSRSRWELLAGKALAGGLAAVLLVVVLAGSSIASGVLIVGDQDLVGLTGQPVAFGEGLGLVALAWVGTLPTALAIAALALLASAVSRSSLVGVVAPALLATVLALVSLLAPLGGARVLLLAPGMQAWHGLLLADPTGVPLLHALLVSLVWGTAAIAATVLVLRRRDWAVP